MPGDSLNLNTKAVPQNTYDAIVIGSGISGGWAAKELTEKGLKVLMLERGRNFEHIKDYTVTNKDRWDLPHHGTATLEDRAKRPVIARGWAIDHPDLNYWVNEQDCPYTEIKPFTWWRSYQLGGRSILWGRQSYRWSDFDFEANAKDGIAVDWPVRYKDLAPWYDYVEKFAGISGSKEGLPQLPDGQFLPPMDLNCVEKDVSARIREKMNRHMIIGRTANLTAAIPGRTQCQFRNRCWEGCPFGGYFSTQSSTLPAALKTGNLTVRPYSIVTRIIYDKDSQKAKGVEVLDAETNKTYQFFSKIVFLNASALNSAWVLMNSATDIWPEGLGSSSGELGHNVMDHHYNCGASGKVDGYEDKYYYGKRANGFYIVRFANLLGDKRPNYLRGFGYQGGASRQGWSRDVAELNVGAEFKEALSEPGQWSIGMTGFGEILPDHENRIYLDKNRKDKWGLQVLAMDAVLRQNELEMRKDMVSEAKAMLEAAGVKEVNTWDSGHAIGHGIHEMGTARMGRDAKTSVLNEWNQVWDCKNLYVTDGACMTSSACQNPSLTYMALTARAADHAVSELKKQNI
jgi:choline dehydrogenase-like flavoprotein